MISIRLQASAVFLGGTALLAGCGGDDGGPSIDYDAIDPIEYSQHVQPILAASCNSAACHNSADAAFGLDLESYDGVEAGSDFGSMVVPFESDRSHFYLHLTGDIEPRMPLGRNPLEDQVVRFLRRWIDEGARDDLGNVMYDGVTRKAFVACQGENAVAVVDMDTGHLARLLRVEKPHSVYVDPVRRRLYVSRFETAPNNIQVFDADTYEPLLTGRAGTFPALMQVTPDGSQLWVTNFGTGASPDHRVRVLDPDTLDEIAAFLVPGAEQPHGLAMTADGSTVWICNIQSDNVMSFKTNLTTTGTPSVDLLPIPLPAPGGARAIHEPQQCVLSADETRLFVSALKTDKVYVLDLTIPEGMGGPQWTGEVTVGDGPWHLTVSPDGTELWVANWLGETVSVLDLTNPDAPVVVATLDPVHPVDPELPVLLRPIGIQFSADGSEVYVACANDDDQSSGHHPAPDGEKNPGNVAVFDAATRALLHVAEVPNFARFVSLLP